MTPPAPILLVEDPRFKEHRSPPGHPERPERLEAVGKALSLYRGQLEALPPRAAEVPELLRVHDASHLARIEASVRQAPGQLNPDTFVSARSYEVALLAAGSTSELARRVARGEAAVGFSAVRPPGHHAEADRAMGFCLFNNIAIAARALQEDEGVGRLLILDWDVHHGNGTQHSFERDPSILYVSTHQFPHYPGTGAFDEAGSGAGVGATLNVPLPAGCGDTEYIGVLLRLLVPAVRRFAPEMILVSCGFDAHRDDPLADMQLTGDGYRAMTRIVRALAEEVCGGRLVFVLEGGYAPSGLFEGTRAVLEALLEEVTEPLAAAPELKAGSTLRQVVDRVTEIHAKHFPGIGAA